MKNLKVYSSTYEKRKFKLDKVKSALIVIGLSATLLLSACGNEPAKFALNTNSVVTSSVVVTKEVVKTETVVNEQYITQTVPVVGIVETDLISVNNDNVKTFINYINSLETEYEYSEIFDVKNSLLKYESNKFTIDVDHEYDLLNGSNMVDTDLLYESVKRNNKQYLKDNDSSLYKKMSDKEIKKICAIIAETINSVINDKDYIDLEELSCNLGSLKIFNKNSSSTAFISTDNCLGVSDNMMEVLQKMNKSIDTYRNTIMHESMHIVQRTCDDIEKENSGKNIGISYKWDDQEFNPLNFTWFFEGAAEKNVMNMTGDKPLVYQNMINYLESLSISTIMDNEVEVNQTEELDFKKNLDALFSQFNCKTENEKIELINMMVSINLIQVEPTDFNSVYQKAYGINLDKEEYAKVKCVLKASVVETLTKYFYKNLTEKLTVKDITLQDVFYLITLFENDVNGHIKYTDINYSEYNKKYIEWYTGIQNEFFYTISLSGQYTQQEIEEKFENYNPVLIENDEKKQNFSLSWLESDKVSYLDEQANKLSIFSGESIRVNQQRMYNTDKKKTK